MLASAGLPPKYAWQKNQLGRVPESRASVANLLVDGPVLLELDTVEQLLLDDALQSGSSAESQVHSLIVSVSITKKATIGEGNDSLGVCHTFTFCDRFGHNEGSSLVSTCIPRSSKFRPTDSHFAPASPCRWQRD